MCAKTSGNLYGTLLITFAMPYITGRLPVSGPYISTANVGGFRFSHTSAGQQVNQHPITDSGNLAFLQG
jgi:hypothetical protein